MNCKTYCKLYKILDKTHMTDYKLDEIFESKLQETNKNLYDIHNLLNSTIQNNQKEMTKLLTTISSRQITFGYNDKSREIIQQVEQWTRKKTCEIIFDSNEDNWDVKTSVFGKKIMNRNNVLILIDTSLNIIIGQYIETTINSYATRSKSGEWQGSIFDKNSFLFTDRDGIITRYHPKQNFSKAIDLWEDNEKQLFNIGKNCIYLYKKGYSSYSECHHDANNVYDFTNSTEKLVGGHHSTRFDVKRLVVYQLN